MFLDRKLKYVNFNVEHITAFEVKKIIDKLDVHKSTGLDGIGPNILRYCGDYITPAVAFIINKSIENGIFPDSLKEAFVIPIFKNGNKEDPNNYRPISILPTISKIFERHIATQIQSFFKDTNIIHETQSGFRQYHSCHTALTHLIDTWLKDVDSGKYVGAVFLDLRKAFDLVDHTILLHKLKLYHFSENTILLFKSYLSNRTQLIKVGNIKSNTMYVTSGVPQGSILGPLLFLLYINDISFTTSTGNIDLYADDSTLYESDNDIINVQNKLQDNLNVIKSWCLLNNMSIHPLKTKCMIICTKQKLKHCKELHLTIDGSTIENVTVQKILGVYVDNTLSWNVQINKVCSKVNSKLALLRRIYYFLTDDMKKLFYNAYIMSIFDYCCTIWGKGNKRYINKISKMQGRVAKVILNKPPRTSTTDLLKELHWLSFSDRCNYHTAVLIYKAKNNLAPKYISNLLTFSSNEKYSLRSATHNDIVTPKHRTNYLKNSFNYTGAHVWNTIPTYIRSLVSINAFKCNYKKYLLQGT